MIGFCGTLDFESRAASFSELKRMCGLHGAGCAFVNGEFGIICDGADVFEESSLRPVTLSYNNALYTAAVISQGQAQYTAQAVLEGYLEEGEEFLHRLTFPYALVLYDSRCGELMLAKGAAGDKALFYTVKDGVLYFASALRPLIRLYGGCVRVNSSALTSYITGTYSPIPENLFCDIKVIKPSSALVCSCFGQACVPLASREYGRLRGGVGKYAELPIIKKADIRHALTAALFAFDYPQFDCIMPSLLPYIESVAREGGRCAYICDGSLELGAPYATERAERLGRLWNVELYIGQSQSDAMPSKLLKAMEKELDGILYEYKNGKHSILSKPCLADCQAVVAEQKDAQLRIRQKALLCQCAMWFDSFNLVID